MDLKQSVAIPGTKIKIPILEVIIAGAGVIAAYVLLKGKSGSSADVSTLPADTTAADTTAADATSVLTGQLETMAQELAALESALASGSVPQTSGGGAGSVIGNGTAATAPADIPVSDLTSPDAVQEIITNTINPKAIITPGTIPGTFTIAMPASKPTESLPAAPTHSVSPEPSTSPSTSSNSPAHGNLASKVTPNPVPPAKSANAASSTTTINPKSSSAVRVSKANAATLAGSK